jgi:Ca-activated chloride channel family protein
LITSRKGKVSASDSGWSGIIDNDLLPLLCNRTQVTNADCTNLTTSLLIGLFLVLGGIIIAGPSWQTIDKPVVKSQNPLILVVDLSPSMASEDIKPSRYIAVQRKITDILDIYKEGTIGLIAYSGQAHVIAPLSTDTNTLRNLLPNLKPEIMPVPGSNIEHALTLSEMLLKNSNGNSGDVIIFSDSIDADALQQLDGIDLKGALVRIIGVGTSEGEPIKLADGSFAKDQNENIITSSVDKDQLKRAAYELGGTFAMLRLDNSDISYLSRKNFSPDISGDGPLAEQWQDNGAVLVIMVLPFLFLLIRKNALLVFLIAFTLTQPQYSHALEWDSLWKNDNQRAHKAMKEKNYSRARELFTDNEWQALAAHENSDYNVAIDLLSGMDSPRSHFNTGNALALAGQYKEAIEAYNTALGIDPELESASKNAEIIRKILEQQQSKQQKQNEQHQKGNEENQDKQNSNQNQKSDSGESTPEKNPKDGIPSEKQSSGQEDTAKQEDADTQHANKNNDNKNEPGNELEKSDQQLADSNGKDSPKENGENESSGLKAADMKEAENSEDKEKQLALKQWLDQVPDNPAYFMKKKLLYQQQQYQQQQLNGDKLPGQEAQQRW